MKKTQKQDRHM